MVAAVLGPERTVVLLVSRPLADQEPEMGSDDPRAAQLGTVPDTRMRRWRVRSRFR